MAIATLMFFIAGLSEGLMDWLQFRLPHDFSRDDLRNSQYWNPLLSWKNKWHDGDPKNGEAFCQSSRLFVFLTDGWHMMKFIRNIFIFAAVLVVATCELTIVQALIGVVLCRLMYGVGFAVTYNWIHKL